MEQKKIKYLYGYDSANNFYEVDNYPWGFKLKTKIRYWIETKKGYGQKFCSQTQNPKTGVWCKPKCSTYSPIAILFLDENNHVKHEALNFYNSKQKIEDFLANHRENLTDYQKEILKHIIATEKVMGEVKVEIFPTSPDEKTRKEFFMDREEMFKMINRKIAFIKKTLTI